MRIGIIGLGRLGAALARGLDRAGGYEIHGFNRSIEKSRALAAQAASLTIRDSATEVLADCDPVFLWMKRDDALSVLEANRTQVARRHNLLVTCIPGVPLAGYTDRWAESFPNVNMSAGRGITLVHFAPGLNAADRALLQGILAAVGSVHETPPGDFTYYSALCSCGPALYATMLEIVADKMAERHGYDREFCRRLARDCVVGTVCLQERDNLDAAGVVARVAHPGGPSEAGVRYLQRGFPEYVAGMFKEMGKW